jgi:hypothetical protein
MDMLCEAPDYVKLHSSFVVFWCFSVSVQYFTAHNSLLQGYLGIAAIAGRPVCAMAFIVDRRGIGSLKHPALHFHVDF